MYPRSTDTTHSVNHVEEEVEMDAEGVLDEVADLGPHSQNTLLGVIHNILHRRTVEEQWRLVY